MTHKAYVVTDLGPGDGGKGGVVHKISHMMRAHTIVKVGGAQGSHGVSTAAGERFAFSQWGCGTFEGTRTHLSRRMVISPEGLLNEAEALRYRHGIHDAFDLLTVDEDALCATPYHGINSRLRELARKDRPRGTVGTGVGEAYRSSHRSPELRIRAGDLSRPGLRDLLAAVREEQRRELASVIGEGFLPADREEAEREIALLADDGFLRYVERRFGEASARVAVVDRDYLAQEILRQDGVIVIESSHGILTDNIHGFHPHVSALRTVPRFTHEMLKEAGFAGQIVNIGVTRAYQIRHGAGPMPTADTEMTESLLPGSHKNTNRYQGSVRVGPLDLNLLRYAIEVGGGPVTFDGLAITWFDQIRTNGEWHLCERYQDTSDRNFFSPSGAIKVRRWEGDRKREWQEALGEHLGRSVPVIASHTVPPNASVDELYRFCADILGKILGVPVRMVSFGPTERDKLCK